MGRLGLLHILLTPPKLGHVSFDQWTAYVFDREVSEPGWWWELPDEEEPFAPPPLDYLRRLSLESARWSKPFSDQQLGQGLWFVFHDINRNLQPLEDRDVSILDRVACVLALPRLYLELFAVRCAPTLEQFEDDKTDWSLSTTCFMFWDIAELHDPWKQPLDRSLDEACLWALQTILRIPHEVSQKSALHGLNHWHERYPRRIRGVVDEFLAGDVRPQGLREYAAKAREGSAG